MTRDELEDSYATWLAQRSWDWFATLTFRGYPPLAKANRLFKVWICELKEANGSPQFATFRVKEGGSSGENIHFHVLVGGLRDRSERLRWIRRWWQLAGDARISYFRKHQNGIRYILKTLNLEEDFDITLDFPPAPSELPSESLRGRRVKHVWGTLFEDM
jgi:hypothetical protein